MIIKVPAPTMGRVVFTKLDSDILPATVVKVHADPKIVDLAIDDPGTEETIYSMGIPYGENQLDHWWWPPRCTEMMEIETE